MTTMPNVWHFRLVAELWAHFNHDTPELPYFERQIARFGQPVLDLGCGTGRLLLPLLAAGYDIDGCDISEDMLYWCRERAERDGLTPNLFCQPMAEFALPRQYRTIYICGSFGLAGGRKADLETLRSCYQHLKPGGALLVNLDVEYSDPESWTLWLKDGRESLPEAWPDQGRWQRAADGSEYVSRGRMVNIDPLEQSYTRQMQVEKWHSNKLIAEELYSLTGQVYFRNEMELALRLTGFDQIEVEGAYKGHPATADDSELMFVAVK